MADVVDIVEDLRQGEVRGLVQGGEFVEDGEFDPFQNTSRVFDVSRQAAPVDLRKENAGHLKRALDVAGGLSCHVLSYDPEFEGVGRMAVALGDIETATDVAVLVPGMGSAPSEFASFVGQARNVYEECRRADRKAEVAVIAWQGYRAPRSWNQWKGDVFDTELAEKGSRLLLTDLDYWRDLWEHSTARENAARENTALRIPPLITLVAHSYATVLADFALGRPTQPGGISDAVKGAFIGVSRETVRQTGARFPGSAVVKKLMQGGTWLEATEEGVRKTVPLAGIATDPSGLSAAGFAYSSAKAIFESAAERAHDASRREPLGGGRVDQLILLGSPGMRSRAKDLNAGLIYTLGTLDDMVSQSEFFGTAPIHKNFAAGTSGKVFRLESTYTRDRALDILENLKRAHTSYYDPGSESLTNIARAITGNTKELTLQRKQSSRLAGRKGVTGRLFTNPPTKTPLPTHKKRNRRSAHGDSEKLIAKRTGISYPGFPKLTGDSGSPRVALERTNKGMGKFSEAHGVGFFSPWQMRIETNGEAVEITRFPGVPLPEGFNTRRILVVEIYKWDDYTIDCRCKYIISQSEDTWTLTLGRKATLVVVALMPGIWGEGEYGGPIQVTRDPLFVKVVRELYDFFPTTATDFSELYTRISSQSRGEFPIDRSAVAMKQTIDAVRKHIQHTGRDKLKKSFADNSQRQVQGAVDRIIAEPANRPPMELNACYRWTSGERGNLVIFRGKVVPGVVAVNAGDNVNPSKYKLLVSAETGEYRLWKTDDSASMYEDFIRKHLSRSDNEATKSADFEPSLPSRVHGTLIEEPSRPRLAFREPDGDIFGELWKTTTDRLSTEQTYTDDDYRNALSAGQILRTFGDAYSDAGQRFNSGEVYLVDIGASGMKVETKFGSGNVFALNDPASSFIHLPQACDFKKTPIGGRVKCPPPLSTSGDRLPILALFGGQELISVIPMDNKWHSITFDTKSLIEARQSIFGRIVTSRSEGSILPPGIQGEKLAPYPADIKSDADTKSDEYDPIAIMGERFRELAQGPNPVVDASFDWRGLARSTDPALAAFSSLLIPENAVPAAEVMLKKTIETAEKTPLTDAAAQVMAASRKYVSATGWMSLFHRHVRPDKYVGRIPPATEIMADLENLKPVPWVVSYEKQWENAKRAFSTAQVEFDDAVKKLNDELKKIPKSARPGVRTDDISVPTKSPSKAFNSAFLVLFAANLGMSVFGGGVEEGGPLAQAVAAGSSMAVAMPVLEHSLTVMGKMRMAEKVASFAPSVSFLANLLSLSKNIQAEVIDEWAIAFDLMGISADVLALLALKFTALAPLATWLGVLLAIPGIVYMLYHWGRKVPLPEDFVRDLGGALAAALEERRVDLHQVLRGMGVADHDIAVMWNSTERSRIAKALTDNFNKQVTLPPVTSGLSLVSRKAIQDQVEKNFPGGWTAGLADVALAKRLAVPDSVLLKLYGELTKYCVKKIQNAAPGALDRLSFSFAEWLATLEGREWAAEYQSPTPPPVGDTTSDWGRRRYGIPNIRGRKGR
ncbi:alpha/beta hydrolase [Streptomyces netropsis]